ncbi:MULTISPECIES: hypothetical protein [unclassified Streptomyces]|uniref:hypothetical protein n=1 Tax=unclassified Streptomyces TaxID=2593676 RepID=UPI0035DA0782
MPTTRAPSPLRMKAPQPPVRPAWQTIEELVWDASQVRQAQAVRTATETRTLGSYTVYAHVGYRADGADFLISAFLVNPEFCMVAGVSPLDASGTTWRHRTMRDGTPEVSAHASLLDAANAAFQEAVERGAWAAGDHDAVRAAYDATPRRVHCEACGR